MAKIDVKNLNNFESKLIKYMQNVTREVAHEATKEFEKEAEKTMNKFYESYTPKSYHRTGNLRRSYKRYFHDNNKRYYVGIRFTSEKINQNYKIDKNVVLNLALQGVHGLPEEDKEGKWKNLNFIQSSFKPYNYMIKYRDNYIRTRLRFVINNVSKKVDFK